MSGSLRTRLALSYGLVALLCVLLVSALANGVLESGFRRYVQASQQKRALGLAAQVAAQRAGDGSWDPEGLAAVGMAALEQGMILKLTSPDGATVWDASAHNSGLCVQMLTHMAGNMSSRYPNWRGSYAERGYPVRDELHEVGTLTVGYYGPFFLNDEQLTFINSLNRLLLWSALGALAPAVGLGLWMARRITIPLARVQEATQAIARGRRDVRIRKKTGMPELDSIAGAVNDLARALGEQEALRRRLTADMAHELRTPLATLQSHLEALLDGVWKPDPERLNSLHEELLRLTRLVAGLEDLARLEGPSAGLHPVDADLDRLVGGIVTNHVPQFLAKGVALRFTGGGGARLKLDVDKLSQAVINLLSNALEFTPRGGAVEVVVESLPGEARIRVTDSGSGIRPEDLPRVFERFYRADSSRSRATGGAGIGLSIAKAIVEAHGGSIEASSAPGQGAEFCIRLTAGRRV